MNIEEVYTAQSLISYYQTLKSSDDQHYKFIGEAMFPSLKRKGLKLSWVLGSKNVPAVLKPSAFDVKSPIRDRISVRSVETEMPFFKESMTFTEQETSRPIKSASRAWRIVAYRYGYHAKNLYRLCKLSGWC